MPASAPYISKAIFCERIDEDERGIKSFINSIDTITFEPKSPDDDLIWGGKLEIEMVFGDYAGEFTLQLAQRADGDTDRNIALEQSFDTTQFPGMRSISLSLDYNVQFQSSGTYWHEISINGELKTMLPLNVKIAG